MSMAAAQVYRIGIAGLGDARDPGFWSGTPYNIGKALRSFGIEVVPIDVRVPLEKRMIDIVAAPHALGHMRAYGLHRSVDRARLAARESLALSAGRGLNSMVITRRRRPLDGVIQIGTGYRVRHSRVVSYEDMTIPQALGRPEYHWGDVPLARRRARVRQQSAAYARLRGAAFSTSWAAASAIGDLGCKPASAKVVGIGPNFAPRNEGERTWSTPRFVFAGRGWNRKNGASVLQAFAEVRHQFPDAELHLAGDHPRIDMDGVTGHGYLSLSDAQSRGAMANLWSIATCCVAPSTFEPAGIIYVDAMHAGIPSIGTANGGASNIIGDAGLTVDPSETEDIAKAMLRYCDPELAYEVGARAQVRAHQFTWDVVARGLLDALELPLD